MTKIKISGGSDDLIEVDGDFSLEEDYNSGFVELSTGDVFSVKYDHAGIWRVEQVVTTGLCQTELIPCLDDDEDDEGDKDSEEMIVTGPIDWVRVVPLWPITAQSMFRRVEYEIDSYGLRDCNLPPELIKQIFDHLTIKTKPSA